MFCLNTIIDYVSSPSVYHKNHTINLHIERVFWIGYYNELEWSYLNDPHWMSKQYWDNLWLAYENEHVNRRTIVFYSSSYFLTSSTFYSYLHRLRYKKIRVLLLTFNRFILIKKTKNINMCNACLPVSARSRTTFTLFPDKKKHVDL